MDRKIILNLAISLDGYIADEDGNYEWIEGGGNHNLDTEKKWDYAKFLDNIDLVVMGKNVMTKDSIRIFRKRQAAVFRK